MTATMTQPINLPRFRPGLDYQVSHEGKLINGRKYRAGEILDQAGLTQRQIEMLRDQRIVVDIPFGGEPVLPIPRDEPAAPLTDAEKAAMQARGASSDKPQGKVIAKHRGFGKWCVVDDNGKNIGAAFEPGEDAEGRPAKTRAMLRAIEINDENGHPVTEEERSEANMAFKDKDD